LIQMSTVRRLWLPIVIVAVSLLLVPSASAEPSPIRRHIKEAKKALLAIEKEIGPLVRKTTAMQKRTATIDERLKKARRAVAKLSKKTNPEELVIAFIAPEFIDRLGAANRAWKLEAALKDLASAQLDKEAIGPLLPKLRDHLWELGGERKDRIDDLDLAIDQLEAVRGGDVPIKAGVGGGKLITYSADWEGVSMCESSGRWHINTGLFDGGLQFLPSTWWMFGGGEYARFAFQATKKQQIDIAERVLAVQGPKAWPNCFKPLPVDVEE
jgi:Transglycosylase-like domain